MDRRREDVVREDNKSISAQNLRLLNVKYVFPPFNPFSSGLARICPLGRCDTNKSLFLQCCLKKANQLYSRRCSNNKHMRGKLIIVIGQTDRLNITRNIYSDSWFRFDCRIQSCTPMESESRPRYWILCGAITLQNVYQRPRRHPSPLAGGSTRPTFCTSCNIAVLLHGCIIRFQSWGTRTQQQYGMPPEWLTVFSSLLLHGPRLSTSSRTGGASDMRSECPSNISSFSVSVRLGVGVSRGLDLCLVFSTYKLIST